MKKLIIEDTWFTIRDIENVSSPSLILYPDRIEANIRKMITIAGPDRLRPHVKTHKMPGVVRLMMKYGIYKIKCATIAEAEMAAICGIKDILLAIQPVGPNLERFFQLKQKFPEAKISCIVDSEEIINQMNRIANLKNLETHLWVDINNGMNRTGTSPDEKAVLLYKTILNMPMLHAEGLHVYDGHIHEKDISLRKKKCDDAYRNVTELIEELKSSGISNVKVVAGGTPTFPIHAVRDGVETSPGTILLMDWGYSSSFADLNFLHAAVLLTRVVSKPARDLICIDLGTKAVASEMPQPRIRIAGLENYEIVGHNEEHMVIRTVESEKLKPGDPLYCFPWHICPTVDRYDIVYIAEDQNITGIWEVEARKRKISI